MPVRPVLRILAIATAGAILVAGRTMANAQFMAPQSCAATPEGAGQNVRALTAACGSATFTVDGTQRRLGQLQIATEDNVYVRSVKLHYRSADGGAQQWADIQLHRLLSAGEATEAFATSRGGLGLASVTVDVSPPGYGAGAVRLALTHVGEAGLQTEAQPAGQAVSMPASNEWILIGSSTAHLTQLRDTIPIGRSKGRFDALVISGRGNDLPVQSILVLPVNGPPFAVDLRALLTPGMASGVVAIDPPDFVQSVTVTYGTPPLQSRSPILEVRGHYAESWLGHIGENRQFAGGWVLLGTVDVVAAPHHSGQRDRFRIAGQDGPFKKLRFVARRGAVDLGGVTVEGAQGQQETVPVNSVLMPDAQSPAFALSSGAMPIASVALNPRLNANSRIDAAVEVWAQY